MTQVVKPVDCKLYILQSQVVSLCRHCYGRCNQTADLLGVVCWA